MPYFRYQALNPNWQQVAGELQAENVEDAIAQLEARGLGVQSIGYASSAATGQTLEGPTTDKDAARVVMKRTVLGEQLARVREGAKIIAPALRAYSQEMPGGGRRRELETLVQVLESDDAVDAEKAFAELPDYWLPLLSAATSSHDPGRVLQGFLRETQRADEIRRQWLLTISYPLVIACLAGAVMVLLSVLVIPIFRDIFNDFMISLPWFTLVMINVASVLAAAVPFLFIVSLLAIACFVYFLVRTPLRSNNFAGRLPAFFFGRATAIAQFSQFLADLLEAGLSIPDSLRVTGYLSRKKRLQQAAWRLADQMELDADAARHINAPRGTATIYCGLQAEMSMQSRIRLLREISQVYTDMARRRLSWTRGIIEPLAILAVGSVVAAVVVSLFWPLVRLIDNLSH